MDKNTLYPIYGMVHTPFWQTNFFYILIAIFGLLLLSLVIWFGLRKYRVPKKNKKVAWEVALEDLAAIESDLATKGMLGKTFYFRLTWMFKRYLSTMYKFDVYGKTDEELVLYLEGSGLATDLVDDLKAILEGSTVVKFANEQALKERMQRDLIASKEFIEKTIPKQVETS